MCHIICLPLLLHFKRTVFREVCNTKQIRVIFGYLFSVFAGTKKKLFEVRHVRGALKKAPWSNVDYSSRITFKIFIQF